MASQLANWLTSQLASLLATDIPGYLGTLACETWTCRPGAEPGHGSWIRNLLGADPEYGTWTGNPDANPDTEPGCGTLEHESKWRALFEFPCR